MRSAREGRPVARAVLPPVRELDPACRRSVYLNMLRMELAVSAVVRGDDTVRRDQRAVWASARRRISRVFSAIMPASSPSEFRSVSRWPERPRRGSPGTDDPNLRRFGKS